MERTFDLYSEEDAQGGTRHVLLRVTDQGGLILEGQDLGGAVSLAFPGSSEYEWGWALPRARVAAFLRLFNVRADSSDWFDQVGRGLKQVDPTEVQKLFKENGAEFWSRHGD